MTGEQIEAAFVRCRGHASPWLPSIGQFVQWAHGAALDLLPSEFEARTIMMAELAKQNDKRDWSGYHPGIFWAYSRQSPFDWRQMQDKQLVPYFSQIWACVIAGVKAGKQYELPKIALPAPGASEAPASHETAVNHLDEIKQMVGFDGVVSTRDTLLSDDLRKKEWASCGRDLAPI